MTGPPDPRLSLAERRTLAWARAGALVTDTLIVAYAAWCASFVHANLAGEIGHEGWLGSGVGFLGRRPWLLLLAPWVAVLWETTGRSMGQRANRIRILDKSGRPAGQDRLAWRGVLAAVQVGIAFVPAALGVLREHAGLDGGFFFFLSLLLTLAFLAFGFADVAGRGLPDLLAGTKTSVGSGGARVHERTWWRRLNPWVAILLLGLTVAVAVLVTGFDPGELVENVSQTFPLLSRLFDPDWAVLGKVVEKMVETVFLAFLASLLALPFAFVIGFLGARNVMTGTVPGKLVYVLTRVFMNVTRSIEPLVWVIIFSLWVQVGPDAGMLALFVHSVAALGKLYSESVEAIDPGPVEAIRATGANAIQTLRYGVVPQVVPPFLSFTIYRWDINVRMATILGLVGGGGIGELLINYQQLGVWEPVGTILLLVTLVVWSMDWASSKARERLV